MARRVAILRVDFEMLHRALGLPSDVVIDEVRAAPNQLGILEMRLEGERFAHVPNGYVIPTVGAAFHTMGALTTLSQSNGEPLNA
jgi:hypothetical protein